MAGIAVGTGNPNLAALTRDLCFEATGDTGLFPSEQRLYDYLNISHRELYNRVCELQPAMFGQRSADLTTTAAGVYVFGATALHTHGAQRIILVEWKNSGGNYIPLDPHEYLELDWQGTAGGGGSLDPDSYAILGHSIYLHPEPTSTKTIRITFAPGVAAWATSDTAEMPFGGQLQQYHELVAYGAALIALEKDSAPERIRRRYEKGLEDLTAFVRRRQAQRTRHVLMTDHDFID